MLFSDLADEFSEILTLLSDSSQNLAVLLGRLRDTATAAGDKLLDKNIRETLPLPPETGSSWFHFSSLSRGTVLFRGACHSWLAGLRIDPPIDFEALTESLWRAQSKKEGPDYSGHKGDDCICFRQRLIFFEAATQWFPQIFPNSLDSIPLDFWTCETNDDKEIRLLSDCINPGKHEEARLRAIVLARASAQACQILQGILESPQQDPSTQPRDPASPAGAPPPTEAPFWEAYRDGKILMGWLELLKCLGIPNVLSKQKMIKRYQEKCGGPIVWIGHRPRADHGALKAWWGQLGTHVEQAGNRAKTIRLLEDPHLRFGEDLHEEKRPNAKGKARKAPNS